MQLTQDQQNAADAFAVFMASPDTEFAISGPAGVGKTALLRYLRDERDHIKICEMLGKRPITNWAFTATTNKAAEVLGIALGDIASTVHSFLGLKIRNDYKTGDVIVTRPPNHEVVKDTVVVVDEASMVDSQLLRLIRESTFNCKIVFIGDHCQLAPVREPNSPVFNQITPVTINQIVRSQHTPAITALNQQLRRIVETGVFEPIQEVPGVIDYLDPDQAMAEIRVHFVDNRTDSRILAYTNKKVVALNNWIRTERQLPPRFTVGETVVASNAAEILDSGKGQKTRIEQELRILAVENDTTETIIDRDNLWYEVPCYNVLTTGGMLRVPVDPAALNGLAKMFANRKDWGPYFKCKEDFADLRPQDTCTVYKAQGSTYHTVFIDLSDIGTCTNASQAARLLYVACSRPTHRICFFGALPPRLRGG